MGIVKHLTELMIMEVDSKKIKPVNFTDEKILFKITDGMNLGSIEFLGKYLCK